MAPAGAESGADRARSVAGGRPSQTAAGASAHAARTRPDFKPALGRRAFSGDSHLEGDGAVSVAGGGEHGGHRGRACCPSAASEGCKRGGGGTGRSLGC